MAVSDTTCPLCEAVRWHDKVKQLNMILRAFPFTQLAFTNKGISQPNQSLSAMLGMGSYTLVPICLVLS